MLDDNNWDSAQWIDDTGPIAPKQYRLWLTHDEIHLLHWAFSIASAILGKDEKLFKTAYNLYTEVAVTKFDEASLIVFMDKFDATHKLARIDDGEEVA